MKYLSICEWKKYQHYKDRNPPWIKLHRDLLNSYTWIVLDDASRLLAIVCMILASETDNKIPLDREFIQRRSQLKAKPNIQPLIDIGFAEVVSDQSVADFASAVLADDSNLPQNATPEGEKSKRQRREEGEPDRRKQGLQFHFSLPSLGEITAYCVERNNHVDPEDFFNHYTSNGWKVGRSNMKDWHAAVRTWEKNDFKGASNDGYKTSAQLRNERSSAALERAFSETPDSQDEPSPLFQGVNGRRK